MYDRYFDILVLGSGVAGLSFALYLSRHRKDLQIGITSKSGIDAGNTTMAQGGIAVANLLPGDSFAAHIRDTYKAGHHKGELSVIKFVVENAPDRIDDLIKWGVPFDLDERKGFDLHKEGGHQFHRILHCTDQTGKSLHECLLDHVDQTPNIETLAHTEVFSIQKDGSSIVAHTADHQLRSCFNLYTSKLVMANGGCGQLFQRSTNATEINGDAIFLGHQLDLMFRDLHHIQFHPTVLHRPGISKGFLLSEAMRGFGAHLLNKKGNRFMFKYDSKGEMATRDIICEAMEQEMKIDNQDHLYLSLGHLSKSSIQKAFPFIYKNCWNYGYDLSKEPVPISPAAHYQCGGISVDLSAQTSDKEVMAIGECSCTGLHGANRLASNSLLEALVFAHQAAMKIADTYSSSSRTFEKLKNNDLRYDMNNESQVACCLLKNEASYLLKKAYQKKEEISMILQEFKEMKYAISRLEEKAVFDPLVHQTKVKVYSSYSIIRSLSSEMIAQET